MALIFEAISRILTPAEMEQAENEEQGPIVNMACSKYESSFFSDCDITFDTTTQIADPAGICYKETVLDTSQTPCPAWGGGDDGLSLEEFIQRLPKELEKCEKQGIKKTDPIRDLVSAIQMSPEEWKKYAFFEPSKLYTRNLVATDDKTFTILLLCWNPGKASPIHDHPCDGCWVKSVHGAVVETLYEISPDQGRLVVSNEREFLPGQVSYIDDSLGLHKVCNPDPEQCAVTLHIYSPPYTRCKAWTNTTNADNFMKPKITYYSAYGKKVEY